MRILSLADKISSNQTATICNEVDKLSDSLNQGVNLGMKDLPTLSLEELSDSLNQGVNLGMKDQQTSSSEKLSSSLN